MSLHYFNYLITTLYSQLHVRYYKDSRYIRKLHIILKCPY